MPSLSVIIPAYNGRDYILETLRSLTGQTRRDFEIIVIDDGSSDDTAQIVTAFITAHGAAEPEIRLLQQANAGVSAARNRGIAEARAPLVGFVDADDLWASEKVALHLDLMAQRPDIDMSYSGFDFIDGDSQDQFDGICPPEGVLGLEQLMVRNLIHTGTVVARRDVVQQCGGFDTQLSTFEDFDLWLKIAAIRPANIYGMARSLACYRRHGNQATGNWRKMQQGWAMVAQRLARDHPAQWGRAGLDAWICNTEYCASLAYNAGDVADMRRLMGEVWAKGLWRVMRHKNALFMSGVCAATFLPRVVQIWLGKGYLALRKAIYALRPASRSREMQG